MSEESMKAERDDELRDEPLEATTTHDEEEEVDIDLSALCKERDDYLANWKRAQADYQNLKRRGLADIDAALLRGQRPLIEDILLVLDHLEMALSMPCTGEEAKNLLVGVQMTRNQMMSVLQEQEVERISTDGPFDPALHQAMTTIETTDAEPGSILETVRSGWTHKGQVLRFAQVTVSSAPAEASENPDE
jgi:molecular chaperone GrpE